MTPEYITIHSTGNPTSTARNERAWLTNPNNNVTASWHIVVDEKEAIEDLQKAADIFQEQEETAKYQEVINIIRQINDK